MNYPVDANQIKREAIALLQQGEAVTAQKIATTLGISADERVTAALEIWWLEIESLAAFKSSVYKYSNTVTPSDGLNQSLLTLWQDAVKEAKIQLLESDKKTAKLDEASRLEDDDDAFVVAAKLNALENSYQILADKHKQQEAKFAAIEAEKLDLTKDLKKAGLSQKTLDNKLIAAHETIIQLERDIEIGKTQLDIRIKKESQRYQELGQKLENQLTYFQNELKKTKEDWSTQEATFKSQIKALQTQQSTDKKVIDSQKRQLTHQEQQIQIFREETHNVAKNLSTTSSQTLNSKNQIKRLEEALQQKEPYIKELKKRIIMTKSETTRRENEFNALLRDKEAELNLLVAKCKGLQRSLIARDEELRRLREVP